MAVSVTFLVVVPDSAPVTTGGAVSTLTVCDLVASTLPAASVERYSTRRSPSPVTGTAMVYVVHSPPAMRYSIEAMPDPSARRWRPA